MLRYMLKDVNDNARYDRVTKVLGRVMLTAMVGVVAVLMQS
jgi:hypothetical protein